MLQMYPIFHKFAITFCYSKSEILFVLAVCQINKTNGMKGRTTLPSAVEDPNGLMARGMSRYVSVLALSYPHCLGR